MAGDRDHSQSQDCARIGGAGSVASGGDHGSASAESFGISPDEYGNRSVVAGFAVLKALMSIGRPALLGEIASALKMTGSRTHRFLAGLEKVGAICHDSETGKYSLGPLLIELGASALSQIDTTRMGMEAISELAQNTGLVSILSAWGSNGPVVIKWTQGSKTTALHVHEGTSLALLTTATGLIYLAYLPREKTENILAAEMDKGKIGGGSWTMAEVEAMIAHVKRDGVAFSRGKIYPSLIAMSCPVFDWNGNITLTLTIIGDSTVVNMDKNSGLVTILRAAGMNLSGRIGYARERAQRAG